MLTILPNKEKSGIQLIFTDFFTKEEQFVTAFHLNEAKEIGRELIKMVEEIQKNK